MTNRFFPSLGNHDWLATSGTPPLPQPYLDFFSLPGNERYYTFTQGDVQFFALDSDSREPDGITASSPQAQWLQAQLAASPAVWKVVYFHHASYSSGPHGNTADLQWPFRDWGASVVLSGHDHDYERLTVGGLTYLVNGLGGDSKYAFGAPVVGSQVRYNEDYGALLVDADQAAMTFQFLNRAGTIIDTYTLTNSTPLYEGWRNLANPCDVNARDGVTPLDVLLVINYLNAQAGNTSLPAPPTAPPPYYDVNGDQHCTAIDALLVINYINGQGAGESTAEAEGELKPAEHATRARLEDTLSDIAADVFDAWGRSFAAGLGRGW